MSLYNIEHKIGSTKTLKNGQKLLINTIKITSQGVFYYNNANNILYKSSDFVSELKHDRPLPVSDDSGTPSKKRGNRTARQSKNADESTADDRPSDTHVLRGDEQEGVPKDN